MSQLIFVFVQWSLHFFLNWTDSWFWMNSVSSLCWWINSTSSWWWVDLTSSWCCVIFDWFSWWAIMFSISLSRSSSTSLTFVSYNHRNCSVGQPISWCRMFLQKAAGSSELMIHREWTFLLSTGTSCSVKSCFLTSLIHKSVRGCSFLHIENKTLVSSLAGFSIPTIAISCLMPWLMSLSIFHFMTWFLSCLMSWSISLLMSSTKGSFMLLNQ